MKRYKIVDKKAPRFRRSKYRYNVINKDLHQRFVEETNIDIEWELFKEINKYINLEIRDTAIKSRNGVILPKQMGNIWLGLFKMKERPLNEPYIRNTGNHATYFSFETSGLQGKICWDFNNVKYKVRNYTYWGFVGHRDFKTMASHNFLENPELYTKINSIVKREEIFKKTKLENEFNNKRDNISDKEY